ASPGGAENRHLHGKGPGSHRWYRDFFHNHVYVSLTHMPRASLPPLLWRLYRGHVMNRPYASEGLVFLARRHRVLVGGALGRWAAGGATVAPAGSGHERADPDRGGARLRGALVVQHAGEPHRPPGGGLPRRDRAVRRPERGRAAARPAREAGVRDGIEGVDR